MSEKEKSFINEVADKLPQMDDVKKAYLMGFMEGCQPSSTEAEAFKDKSDSSDSETKGEN